MNCKSEIEWMIVPAASTSRRCTLRWMANGASAAAYLEGCRRMESGVSASTLTRLSQGRQPDVNSLAALTAWLGMSADHFMRSERVAKFGAPSPLAQISSIIHRDPRLNPEGSRRLRR